MAKSSYAFSSTLEIFFLNIFDLPLVEPINAESGDKQGQP